MNMPEKLYQWAVKQGVSAACDISPLKADASARRYYRLVFENKSVIAMDASLEKTSCLPFMRMAAVLDAAGLRVPSIDAIDFAEGFMLLEDLGDNEYLSVLREKKNPHLLYENALDALIILQRCSLMHLALPDFAETFAMQELMLFEEWFCRRWRKLSLSDGVLRMLKKVFQFLASAMASQPQVLVHRDYHAGNLMLLPQGEVGMLDFQDAVIGSPVYDVVSLLRDAYIDWPESDVRQWALLFWNKSWSEKVSAEIFMEWFDIVSVQRHLKVLMIFSRKFCRDNNPHYLQYIPRVLHYLLQETQCYPVFSDLRDFLSQNIKMTDISEILC